MKKSLGSSGSDEANKYRMNYKIHATADRVAQFIWGDVVLTEQKKAVKDALKGLDLEKLGYGFAAKQVDVVAGVIRTAFPSEFFVEQFSPTVHISAMLAEDIRQSGMGFKVSCPKEVVDKVFDWLEEHKIEYMPIEWGASPKFIFETVDPKLRQKLDDYICQEISKLKKF